MTNKDSRVYSMCAKEAEQLRLQGVPYLGAAKYGFHCNYETAAIRLSRTIVYWSSFKMYFEVSQFQKLTFGTVYCEPSPKYNVNLKDQFTAYRKIASSSTSCLEANVGFFRLLMKGIFGPYVP